MRVAAFLFLVPLLSGCGNDARLEAEARAIKADGTSSTRITFHADLGDGEAVYFETDEGHFLDDGYEVQYLTRSLAGGSASVELYSSIHPGSATVVATTDYGHRASITIEFTAMRPSGRNLSFECESVNIAALTQPVPDLAVRCTLRMQDRDGTAIDPRSLSSGDFGFATEAGQIRPEVVDDGYGNFYFLYTAQGGATEPVDVEPIDDEPQRFGDTGGTRNPRDGLVTLVAWVRGEEGFRDINSNGIYEPEGGETFDDMGEPFVDVDDDGVFDPGAGDVYQDVDGNGRYTEPNGRWDEEAVVWTTFKILWTGPIHQSADTTHMELQGVEGRAIPSGATRQLAIHLLDRNINPLAATADDSLTITESTGYASLGTYTFAFSNTRGFEVDSNGLIEGNLFDPPVITTSLTNNNTYPDDYPSTITGTAYLTPAPMFSDGTIPYQSTVEIPEFRFTLIGAPGGD